MNREPAHSISKRGRLGEGRPTKRTPEVVAKIAEAIAIGLTDEEASLLAGINSDTMTEWRKEPEFSGAIKRGRSGEAASAPGTHRGRRAGVAGHSLGAREALSSSVRTT
jgi:hypothetical protein